LIDQLFLAKQAKADANANKINPGSKQNSLHAYLTERHWKVPQACRGRPTLKFVLFERPNDLGLAKESEAIELLRLGTDPNEQLEGNPPWRELLISTYRDRNQVNTSMEQTRGPKRSTIA
jgi:hypothetical protein